MKTNKNTVFTLKNFFIHKVSKLNDPILKPSAGETIAESCEILHCS